MTRYFRDNESGAAAGVLRTFAALVLSTAGVIAGTALAEDLREWVEMSEPEQLRWLYSNKTHVGTYPGGTRYVGYYYADGSGVLLVRSRRLPRSWAVVGSTVCTTAEGQKSCFTFKRNPNRGNEFAAFRVGRDYSAVFLVEEGVSRY